MISLHIEVHVLARVVIVVISRVDLYMHLYPCACSTTQLSKLIEKVCCWGVLSAQFTLYRYAPAPLTIGILIFPHKTGLVMALYALA